MGKPSRDKGKRGENEIVDLYREAGFPRAKRTAALQAGLRHYGQIAEADVWVGDDFHVEVKRQEVLRIPTWLRQLDTDCPEGRAGILFYRQSRQRWRAVVKRELLDELEATVADHLLTYAARSTAVAETDRVEADGVELAHRMVEAGWVG